MYRPPPEDMKLGWNFSFIPTAFQQESPSGGSAAPYSELNKLIE